MHVYNFGGSGHNLTKFYQRMWLKISEGKNVENSAQFLTTFKFDRKYLRNGSTYLKSEKYLINNISSPIGRKKICELRSTNNNGLTHPSGLFSGY